MIILNNFLQQPQNNLLLITLALLIPHPSYSRQHSLLFPPPIPHKMIPLRFSLNLISWKTSLNVIDHPFCEHIRIHQPLSVLLIDRKKLYDRPAVVTYTRVQVLEFTQRHQKQRIVVARKLEVSPQVTKPQEVYIPVNFIDSLPKIGRIGTFKLFPQNDQILQNTQTIHPNSLYFLNTRSQVQILRVPESNQIRS